MPKIFIIAGEESGDLLGAAILRALPAAEVRGIGGVAMEAAGMAPSLIPMKNLSVMGIFEIVPRIPYFLRAINETVRAIENFAPDVVITIDSPDFCFWVQKKLKQRGVCPAPRIHVVAPTVWAWRMGRARKIAGFLDGLVCLFPFEPPYFTRHGLRSISMGHPMIESNLASADPAPLRAALAIGPDDIVMGLYAGSRTGTARRHLPVFIAAINQIAGRYKNVRVLIPTFDHVADYVRDTCAAQAKFRYEVITDPTQKISAMRACGAAVSVTGTIGLELAVAGVPHVAAYRLPWLTWEIVRRMVQTPFAHLVNIILGRRVVPELIQNACTPDALAGALDQLLGSAQDKENQRAAFADVRAAIGEGTHPAQTAAGFIQEFLKE